MGEGRMENIAPLDPLPFLRWVDGTRQLTTTVLAFRDKRELYVARTAPTKICHEPFYPERTKKIKTHNRENPDKKETEDVALTFFVRTCVT